MARPQSGSPRVKHRSYMSDYGSQNGGENPRAFRGSRGGGPIKGPHWKDSQNRGRRAPYPDRRPAPWQQKSPQGRGRGPPPWQSKNQDNYGGYPPSRPPSDSYRQQGNQGPRPGPAHRRPSPQEDFSRPQQRRYDGGPRRFQPHPHNPDHRNPKPDQPQHQPPHHRGPFQPPRLEQRSWGRGRSQSPGGPPRGPPKPQGMTPPGERGRGRGQGRGRARGGRGGRGNGFGRPAFWADRGPDRGPSYSGPRPHYPHPRMSEGRCSSNSPARKDREFHGRERWSSSSERDCNERRSRERERERMAPPPGRHDGAPERWPQPSPSQNRPPPQQPAPWKPGQRPQGPPHSSSEAPPPRRFQGPHTLKGAGRGQKRKFPEMQEQQRPVPPLLKHFHREPSLVPPPRGFGGRGLSLRDKSRLLKNRKFREESVGQFKMFPPNPTTRGRPGPFQSRMGPRPPMGRGPNPRYQAAGRYMDPSTRRVPKRSSPPRKSWAESKADRESPVSEECEDERSSKSPPYRRSSGRHSPTPVDRPLPRDLVVVSQWQAGSPENDGDGDGDGDEHSPDQEDAKEDCHGDSISDSQEESPTKATPSPQDQAPPTRRVVRRPLMSLKTVRPQRKFGQLGIVANKRCQSIVSKYRLMRQRAPPTQALVSQPQQSTSHRRW